MNWNPLARGAFYAYGLHNVLRNCIPRVQVRLTPGDLYFFCTENIHEVERLTRQRRRVVLACFFAMSCRRTNRRFSSGPKDRKEDGRKNSGTTLRGIYPRTCMKIITKLGGI